MLKYFGNTDIKYKNKLKISDLIKINKCKILN